ncbi:hypothetical protein BZZ01_05025 [Nostocales cyanobacterium HT-58-2]|nr:hypothetical protein BZZ01_05025 [Nostocales cyanobacterium HT-58-2]
MDISIWQRSLNRIIIATSNGGRSRSQVWFTTPQGRIQGICATDLKAGECLAVQTDEGEWWLFSTDKPQLENSTERTIEYRVTGKKTKQTTALPIVFSVLEYPDIYRLDITYKSYLGFGTIGRNVLNVSVEIFERRLFYLAPPGVTPEFYITPPQWATFDYYNYSSSNISFSATPPTSGNAFNYQYFGLRYRRLENYEFLTTDDYINCTAVGTNDTTTYLASCILSGDFMTVGFNSIPLNRFGVAALWDDGENRNRCTWEIRSQSLTKVQPSDLDVLGTTYIPTPFARKLYLGGDRSQPLNLNLNIDNNLAWQVFITALRNKRFITLKLGFLNSSRWVKIICLLIQGNTIQREERIIHTVSGSSYQYQNPLPFTINEQDWRRSICNIIDNTNPPSSGDICVDSYRLNPYINLTRLNLYEWDSQNRQLLREQLKTTNANPEITCSKVESLADSCRRTGAKKRKMLAYALNNSNVQIHAAAPVIY